MTALSSLTAAMRACLGTAPAASELRLGVNREPGLSGLYHGATLAALHRHGLADHEWDGGRGYEYRLNDAGLAALAARARLRDRVNAKLAAAGYTRHPDAGLFTHPDWPLAATRAAAMRRSGVKW